MIYAELRMLDACIRTLLNIQYIFIYIACKIIGESLQASSPFLKAGVLALHTMPLLQHLTPLAHNAAGGGA
jgi:hypothetical protein